MSILTYQSDEVGTFHVSARVVTIDNGGFLATTDMAEVSDSFDVVLGADLDSAADKSGVFSCD